MYYLPREIKIERRYAGLASTSRQVGWSWSLAEQTFQIAVTSANKRGLPRWSNRQRGSSRRAAGAGGAGGVLAGFSVVRSRNGGGGEGSIPGAPQQPQGQESSRPGQSEGSRSLVWPLRPDLFAADQSGTDQFNGHVGEKYSIRSNTLHCCGGLPVAKF